MYLQLWLILFQTKDMYNIKSTPCNFNIHIRSDYLELTSTCYSEESKVLQWYDKDPLDIVYYRFGSTDMFQFHVNTGKV
jgi:hypothetical protein